MPRPVGSRLVLSPETRQRLQALVRTGSTPQALALRCRLILRAAAPDHPTSQDIADEFDCGRPTVGQWRERFASGGLGGLRDAPRSGRPRALPPDERVAVVAVATSKTQEHDRPTNGWTLDEIAATLINGGHAQAISQAAVWRILHDADLKPHQSVYWLNSHDPDFEAKAKAICRLYVEAPPLYQQGRLGRCCDEKTGMQIRRRGVPTPPPEPGKPEKREFESERPGTRTRIASFAVPTGEGGGTWGRRAPASTSGRTCCAWPATTEVRRGSTGWWIT